MCIGPEGFAMMRRRDSKKAKDLLAKAMALFAGLNFKSNESEVEEAMKARAAYLRFVYKKEAI